MMITLIIGNSQENFFYALILTLMSLNKFGLNLEIYYTSSTFWKVRCTLDFFRQLYPFAIAFMITFLFRFFAESEDEDGTLG